MNIEPLPSGFFKKVRVRVDNHGEWMALYDGLPKPSAIHIYDLPFAADVTGQLQAIEGAVLGASISEYIIMRERQLRKIGKNLSRLALEPDQGAGEIFGRIAVRATIDDYFTR